MNNLRLIIPLLLLPLVLAAQEETGGDARLSFGKNFRIHPGHIDQTEVLIVKSPVDQNVLFVGCNTLNFNPFFISEGVYSSLDGGYSWQGSDTCTGEPIVFHGGDPGITIDKNGTFILTRLGREPMAGLYSHYSNDHGQTWSLQQVISTDDLERATLMTDINPGSPKYGRTFGAYVKFAHPFPVMYTYSDNGAKSWSTPKQINQPTVRSAGGDLAMGPGGEVYCCWAGVTDISPFREIQVGFARSVNGGDTWQVTENAFPMNGINGVLPNKHNIRVNGLPGIAVDTTRGPRRGWIYIITTQKALPPAGSDPDVVMYRSTDGGSSWSAGIRVNQDPLNNGKTQYFPNIHIDRFGAVNIIFYDDRTTTTDSTGVFLARSLDGGDSWKEYEISDHHFMPVPIGGLGQGYQGDIIDLTSTETALWPVWMDNITGVYQIWTTPVKFADISGINDAAPENGASRHELLSQNHPNPFHGQTSISYRVPSKGRVLLQVFDLLGNLLATLVDEELAPGSYETVFATGSREEAAGHQVIICRLTLQDKTAIRKMVAIPGR